MPRDASSPSTLHLQSQTRARYQQNHFRYAQIVQRYSLARVIHLMLQHEKSHL